MLYKDDKIADRMSGYFKQAFGQELTVHLRSGSPIPLMVGDRPSLEEGEDRLSSTYWERLVDSTVPLQQQGDGMRSFASVILHLLASGTASILLLDEPEAFLHPPQARLLGELLAREKPSNAQLFIATHSPDVLQGLVNVAPDHLRILRMRREGDINRVTTLDNEHIKLLGTSPVMKYSSVMSGVFHDRVIICEGDSDCHFYSSLIDIPEINGGQQPDVLFVNAGGKQRIAVLSEMLVSLGIPVDVIADIDVIRTETDLERIVMALGGDWPSIHGLARRVDAAIRKGKGWKDAAKVKEQIAGILETVSTTGEFPRASQRKIESLFREGTPWGYVKSAGESAIPSGQPSQDFRTLKDMCKEIGLWIVPVGELEGFCRDIGKRSGWVQQVLEKFDLEESSELEEARTFVRGIWESKAS